MNNKILLTIIFILATYLIYLKRIYIKNIWKYRKENLKFYVFISSMIFIIFSIANCIIYYFPLAQENKNILIQIAIGTAGLIWAIFAGYFAFAQFLENRKERLIKEVEEHWERQEYPSALQKLEKIYRIDSSDKLNLQNLSENYSINGNFDRGEEFAEKAHKLRETNHDTLIYYYLKILAKIKNISQSSIVIKELINCLDKDKEIIISTHWRFNELINSDLYKKQLTTEQKQLIDLVMRVLRRKITLDDFDISVKQIFRS